jgi:hypothetical protein
MLLTKSMQSKGFEELFFPEYLKEQQLIGFPLVQKQLLLI